MPKPPAGPFAQSPAHIGSLVMRKLALGVKAGPRPSNWVKSVVRTRFSVPPYLGALELGGTGGVCVGSAVGGVVVGVVGVTGVVGATGVVVGVAGLQAAIKRDSAIKPLVTAHRIFFIISFSFLLYFPGL